MAVLKCKMCGGTLEINNEETVVTCEYCGTPQTVPNVDEEKKLKLYERANKLRYNCDFDKAAGAYESIISDYSDEAEAYWGLILCKYGIEYVDDSVTGKKIPTCHRSSFDSVMDDSDFEMVMENSDSVARDLYRAEAKQIEEIRKGIIEVSGKEEPYDIFICYKETDADGQRTVDSVLAQDVYDALTEKGYRVFFSRITLEDKLGHEYEPYIFAALNSAKIMLAFGTSYNYYNAVWVKNEWSRFLKLMEGNKEKHMIPCYKDLDAYDIPKEFAKLQAQDMGKVGAIQDLLRGIEKLLPIKQEENVMVSQVVSNSGATVESLLERVFMFLEDEEWDSAEEYCERVLDLQPKNAKAYLGKLMAELQVKTPKELTNCAWTFDDSSNYQKAMRFGDEQLKKELEGYLSVVKERNIQGEIEALYIEAKQKMCVQTCKSYQAASELFDKILDYKDSTKLKEKCFEMIKQLRPIEIQKAREISKVIQKMQIRNAQMSISTGNSHTVGLKSDGTVVATGYNKDGRCEVSGWTDIVSVYSSSSHTVGLKSDGTVVATGDNEEGQCEVSGWTDIVSIAAPSLHTFGLKADGTVVATGPGYSFVPNAVAEWTDIVSIFPGYLYMCGLKADGTVVVLEVEANTEISEWTDIVSISRSENHTVGLKSDGTVVATGDNKYGECDVSKWKDIVLISTGNYHTVGLKSDGTVVATGDNKYGECNVSKWKDIVLISTGDYHTVGLKSNGTVVATGDNQYGECDVSEWTKIDIPILAETKEEVQKIRTERIRAAEKTREEKVKKLEAKRNYLKRASFLMAGGSSHSLGVKTDGTAVVVGHNVYARHNVSEWRDIVAVSASWSHGLGLKSDGTVVSTGSNGDGQCDVSEWRDIVEVSAGGWHSLGLKSDGTVVAIGGKQSGQCDVSEWKDIVEVSASGCYSLGLKSDGTVVATGLNTDGECNVSEWRDIVEVSAGGWHSLGLKSDGTVVATGSNDSGRCNVSEWRDIVGVSAGNDYSLGLKSDGTVVATGSNYSGKCNITKWRDIIAISAAWNHSLGLKSDGTLVVAGDNKDGQCNVTNWRLFNNYDHLEEEQQEALICRKRREQSLCQHCGGSFKGFFTKTCTECGRVKDY